MYLLLERDPPPELRFLLLRPHPFAKVNIPAGGVKVHTRRAGGGGKRQSQSISWREGEERVAECVTSFLNFSFFHCDGHAGRYRTKGGWLGSCIRKTSIGNRSSPGRGSFMEIKNIHNNHLGTLSAIRANKLKQIILVLSIRLTQ